MTDPPCKGKGELFFSNRHETINPHKSKPYAEAIALCAMCPYRTPCNTQGVEVRDFHTVRAGLRLWIPKEKRESYARYERTGH